MNQVPTPRAEIAAGTVVTADYLPWALTLAESFSEHHPGSPFVVLVLDPQNLRPPFSREFPNGSVITPGEIGIDESEFGWMELIYEPFELSCALKPQLLRYLLGLRDTALYLDSDMLVYESLANVADLASSTGIAVTPHALRALPPRPDGVPGEVVFLEAGQFNAGMIAVNNQDAAYAFLDFWQTKLRRHCVAGDPTLPNVFVDQRWLECCVGPFNLALVRDPGVNVGHWRIRDDRAVGHDSVRFTADGCPLRLFHFSGFDPGRPDVLSRHQPAPVRPVTPATPLARLCLDYSARLRANDWTPSVRPEPVVVGMLVMTKPLRRAIRAALIEAERLNVVPQAASRDPGVLLRWLTATRAGDAVSWFMWGLRASQPAIAATFPAGPGPDSERYVDWIQTQVRAGGIPEVLGRPAAPLRVEHRGRFAIMMNVSEALSDGGLLRGLAETLLGRDGPAVILRAAGAEPDRLMKELEPALAAANLLGHDSLDIVLVPDPVGPEALAPLVQAVFTRQPVDAAFAGLPVTGEATVLRELLDKAGIAPNTESAFSPPESRSALP